MSRRQHRLALLLVLLPFFLAGCGGDNLADLQDYVRLVKARPPSPIEPLPEVKPIDTFVYEVMDRRDPFVPDAQSVPSEVTAEVGDGLAPDPTRRKEELESYSLDSLAMVGTLDQNNVRWGLVRTKDGILHRVKVGNYMGMNNGQITNISDDVIQLTEIVSDAPGKWRERAASVALTQ